MTDFPNLNMSIGEYYKLLMEGKRPTRQRTVKEEVKLPAPALARAASTAAPGQRRESSVNSATGQLAKSHSEIIGGADKHNVDRQQVKRKLKFKRKMKRRNQQNPEGQQEEQKQGAPVVPPFRGQSSNRKKLGGHVSVMKASLNLKPQIGQSDAQISAAHSKLRQRENQSPQKPHRKSEKQSDKKQRHEGEDHEIKNIKREESRKVMQMSQKFEMVEVHPLYATGRYAIYCSKPQDTHTALEVCDIKTSEEKFTVSFKSNGEESKGEELQSDFDEVQFISKVFLAQLSTITQTPETQKRLEPLFKSLKDNDRRSLLITQIVKSNHCGTPRFAAILPGSQCNVLDIQFTDSSSIFKNLVDIDDYALQQFKVENENVYNSGLESVLKHAKCFINAYSEYVKSTSKIPITKDNLEESLFTCVDYSLCPDAAQPEELRVQGKQTQVKQGVFLRTKFDTDHLLFIKKLGTKNKSKDRDAKSEWLQLQKHRVFSDVSHGYISIECLCNINSDGTNKLKKRNIKMISYRDSLKQRLTLRQISNENNLDEGCEKPRMAIVGKDSSMRPGDRCVLCNYQAQGYDHLRCSHCSKVFHEQCVLLKPKMLHQLYMGVRELNWRCNDCVRCINCLSTCGKSSIQQLMICKCCNSAYHYECMDPNMKKSIPNVLPEISVGGNRSVGLTPSVPIGEIEFHCDRCVQCELCGSREAGTNRMHKWSKDFKLCANCNKMRKRKQYCAICESVWPEEFTTVESSLTNELMKKEMINCGQCGMWVHHKCDRIFQDEFILNRFKEGNTINGCEALQYHCQECRQTSRSNLIRQLIERLANEDKFYFFIDPVEDQIVNYTKIIKTPMCFSHVRKRAQGPSYLLDPATLRKDIALIFENAMKFNLPKHKVHKEAARLGEVCSAVIDSVWNRLSQNSARTLDENRLMEWLREQRKRQLEAKLINQGQKMIRIEVASVEKMSYTLKPEELFDQTEFLPSALLQQQDQLMTSENMLNEDYEGINDFDDEDEGNEDESGQEFQLKKPAVKKNSLRTRKRVNYNEEKTDQLKRQQSSGVDEVVNRISSSSKRARFNQTQQQHSSSFSFALLKGANLLQQALHQQERNQLNIGTNIHNENQSSVTFAVPQQSEIAQIASVAPVSHVQQHQQLMMNYYQEIDDERCYYSNPARCSFDDPTLAFEEMCYLCGSFGQKCDFLSCTLCGESFHTFCLQLSPVTASNQDNGCTIEEDHQLIAKFQTYWKCLNCKYCELCSSATQEAHLLYCDVCDKAFHSFCLSPPLKAIPKCQWRCQECFKCQSCGTKTFFDPLIHLKPGSQNQLLDSIASSSNDFEYSQNFSLCYECGLNSHKKSFCKICQQSNTPTEGSRKQRQILQAPIVEKMIKCNSCGYYCHVKCSRLLPTDSYDDVDQDDFQCLECLLTGKSINHLIRETCEHYENMHHILTRHRLLGQLCAEILEGYFPIPEKAPLFIRAFIESNVAFFRNDPMMNEWLSLLETGVCFPPSNEESTAALGTIEKVKNNDTHMSQKEEAKTKSDPYDWAEVQMEQVFCNTDVSDNTQKTEAQYANERMNGYKEGFLPQKRNLYEALASAKGYHRFGQRSHFMDPFTNENQQMITIPLDENLESVDFAQLYVQFELKAVMKIKLRFFEWFETMIKTVVLKNNQRFLKKRKEQQLKKLEEPLEPSNDCISSYVAQDAASAVEHIEATTFCTDLDTQVDNPQKKLQCVMCKLKGELTVTGRLIPFQVNQFVHVNCALWSTDVHEIADGGYLVNFFQVWSTRAKFTKCWHCGEAGASLFCFSPRHRCQAAYHFPCAYSNRKMAFAPKGTKETFCDACCRGHKGSQLGLPSEFANTRRRFQIAKNQQPWNMTHHTTQIQLQQQSQLAPPLINQTGTSTSAADIEKPLQIEKWRPFYFDMFNRVGNLTVLSLRREINQIIEDYCSTSKQTTITDIGDFATLRIYWKYASESMQSAPSRDKSFYLYSNNLVQEIARNDLETLLPFVSARVKEKVNLGLHYMGQEPVQVAMVNKSRTNVDTEPLNQLVFWQKLIQHFQKERARFTLQNIIFSISEFSGKTKYPVSIWNRGAEGVKNKAFFLRSGEQVLHAQNTGEKEPGSRDGMIAGASQTNGPLVFGSTSNAILPFGKKGEQSNQSSSAAIGGAASTIDDIFKRMTKINQMGDHQNPMTSVKRVNASKHMQYEAVLHNLGKKMFYTAPTTIFEEQAPTNNIIIAKQQKQGSTTAASKSLQKKIRQPETITGQQVSTNVDAIGKESDLPIAMKYRLSKTQPKRVEVGPSKIHRNGLFTHEDLAANDIVIEYVGERIRNKVADKREVVYELKGIGDCYLFRLDREYIIDATFNGNKARYLNHSCDANCSAKIINVQQQKHIIISANRQIKSGEELTYNYNFDYEADKIDCFCGAPGCVGRLN